MYISKDIKFLVFATRKTNVCEPEYFTEVKETKNSCVYKLVKGPLQKQRKPQSPHGTGGAE